MLFLLLTLSACSAETEKRVNREMFEREFKKAEQGGPVAAFHVGSMYRLEIGTSRNPEQALHWYEVAGSRGGWEAIGDMYSKGDRVPPDPDRAGSYYRLAAETGEPLPMYSLGCLHAEPRIAAPDPVEGYMWLLLAQRIGESSGACRWRHYECKEWAIKDRPGCRARVRAALTSAERAEAERRAAAWLATRPFRK
jgi:TPR repeat protein